MLGNIAALAVLAASIGVVLYIVVVYNRFVKLSKTMSAALSDVDVFLKKRYDLVPNLVSTVKGYAAHESEVFKSVADIRARTVTSATVGELAEFEGSLNGALGRLFAVAESYPELKADGNFLQLQSQLYSLEDGIEKARRYYNAVVRDYNIYLDSFPSNLVGATFDYKPGEFYEVRTDEERVAVRDIFGGN